MTTKATYKKVKLTKWPLKPGEAAKLYWVDHPYLDAKRRWTMAVYFKRVGLKQDIYRCDIPWGTLEYMRIGRLYCDGRLLSSEECFNYNVKEQVDSFVFNSQSPLCVTDVGEIVTGDGSKNVITKNYFVLKSTVGQVRIPVTEIIRAILTKNRKLNYAVLEPNSLDQYFIVEHDAKNKNLLRIFFSKDYPGDLLTRRHIEHIIWLGTSSKAKRAIGDIYRSIANGSTKGIHFQFPLEGKFEIKARYIRGRDGVIRIEEIIYFKELNTQRYFVEVYSPHIHDIKKVNKPRIRRHIVTPEETIEIDNECDSSRKSEKTVAIETAQHDFEIPPIIRLKPQTSIIQRTGSNENTKDVEINSNNKVTTNDIGCGELEDGLEFQELDGDNVLCEGDIGTFIKVLIELKNRYIDTDVSYSIGNLPDGMIGKWYNKLDDGSTPRKYAIAAVYINGSCTCNLIEVERQGRPLSTLVLIFKKVFTQLEESTIFHQVLTSLVNNNGSWNQDVLNNFSSKGVGNERIMHTRKSWSTEELANRLYEKLLNI